MIRVFYLYPSVCLLFYLLIIRRHKGRLKAKHNYIWICRLSKQLTCMELFSAWACFIAAVSNGLQFECWWFLSCLVLFTCPLLGLFRFWFAGLPLVSVTAIRRRRPKMTAPRRTENNDRAMNQAVNTRQHYWTSTTFSLTSFEFKPTLKKLTTKILRNLFVNSEHPKLIWKVFPNMRKELTISQQKKLCETTQPISYRKTWNIDYPSTTKKSGR